NKLSDKEQEFIRTIVSVCSGTDVVPSTGSDPVLENKSILSAREHEVLEQIALGITNKEIADHLCISTATVKTHIINIYSKLGVSSRVMAVDEAVKRGILKTR
ncbi:MAG: LuxR C-terminal-related transcriptional regulator, partial [Treponema sp.]|nr:LuxR C-terminal-related transcriptional regulator [Treponema sp.]